MKGQYFYWAAAAIALLLAVAAGFLESRRLKRDNIDDIGWVPWRGVQVTSAFALIVILILAIKLG